MLNDSTTFKVDFACLDVPSDPDRVLEGNTLTFYNVTLDDRMVIQCNATNEHGYIFANAYLNVFGNINFLIVKVLYFDFIESNLDIECFCRTGLNPDAELSEPLSLTDQET